MRIEKMRKFLVMGMLTGTVLLAGGTSQACPTHTVALPTAPGAGQPKEVKELLDTPFVRLVSITLRGGAVLAEHSAPVAVTIQALSGNATVRTGAKKERIGAGQMLLIAPNAAHEVVPDGKADVVLLVHYLKVAGGAADPGHDGHDHGHEH
jgi:quercetin dioxygenase-like cupin family protein